MSIHVTTNKVLGFINRNGSIVRVSSEEKIFTVNAVVNGQNDGYLAASRTEVRGIFRAKHLAQVVVLGIVASNVFKPGETVRHRGVQQNVEVSHVVLVEGSLP